MDMSLQEKRAKRRIAKVSDYKKVFSTPEGERVLRDLINYHFVNGCTYDPALSSNTIFFNEGQRAAVLRILEIIRHDPQKMISELQKAKEQEDVNDWEV